ncbi:MAG TPA: aldehyde dehydrogenase family protein [Anaeromyxobacteraceae bacterium]|nr:aldehyde dehydrogenase family protein [Anaeromyxobacteraceae bacterium]
MDTTRIDEALATLAARKEGWARLPLTAKLELLAALRPRTAAAAERWVGAAVKAKGIPLGSPWEGEEWTSGPYALLWGLGALERTLWRIARGEVPVPPRSALRTRRDGQLVARVFPADGYDRVLLSGVRAEVWMEPGVTADNLREHVAGFYRRPGSPGRVALVLGAGNIASIPPLDLVHKLYAEGQVAILKMNPVNEYLGPIFEEIFAPFVERGFVRFAYGGADVGAFLVGHPLVEEIHITGSERTYDAIRFGTGAEGAERKRRGEPLNPRRITAELGGVAPTIVLPGPWRASDIAFQAEHVASQKLHNGGFNCIATQVLVLPEQWPQKEEFLGTLRQTFRSLPVRAAYYPGAADRQRRAVEAHRSAEVLDAGAAVPRTFIPNLDSRDPAVPAFSEEFFGAILAETSLPGESPAEFLEEAIRFANEGLRGTLGANLVVHPATAAALGPRLEEAIAALRYGSISINTWAGVTYLLPQAAWGAYPGHADTDIQSGRGFVHNALLFDRPQKTVVYAPFQPFPRAWLSGHLHMGPKPPWFVTHRRAHEVGRRLTRLAANPGIGHLPGLIAAALRG